MRLELCKVDYHRRSIIEYKHSKFGVTEDLFLPKVLSNLSESIVNKKIFGGMILDSLTNNSITIIIYLREFHQL